jgi:hypothetical protein
LESIPELHKRLKIRAQPTTDRQIPEPVFVNLLRSPGIDSQPGMAGRYNNNPICRTGPPGYIAWRNRFLGSLNVYKYGLWFQKPRDFSIIVRLSLDFICYRGKLTVTPSVCSKNLLAENQVGSPVLKLVSRASGIESLFYNLCLE